MVPSRIHIFGASGSGTTTLGAGLSRRFGHAHLDTDDFFWERTNPPFEIKRPGEERVRLIREAMAKSSGRWVLTGSLCGWGDVLIPEFELAVFLFLPPEIRMERIRARERERYGGDISPGNRLHAKSEAFLAWCAGYDTAPFPTVRAALPCTGIGSARLPARCLKSRAISRRRKPFPEWPALRANRHNSASQPGGCELGPRPIDLHLSSLKKLGVTIVEDHGYLLCSVEDRLRGASISLPFPSVGATENILLAACTAEGETLIHNPAREPEIEDLINFLNKAGADISMRESGAIYIRGVRELSGVEYSIIPDRIVAATYLCCSAVTGGELILRNAAPSHMTAVFPMLEEMGCSLRTEKNLISLKAPERLLPLRLVRTMPYPGFPTDAQAPLMSLCCIASGTSVFVENIFENRFKHASELARMGARIKVEGRVAVVEGVSGLHGAPVVCTDLRGGAALVVAALAARGVSEIMEISHIERGYQNFDKNLAALGATISLR